MTALLDHVPIDEITERAKAARPGRTVLTLIAAVLFAIGWLAARTFGVLWLAVTWSWAAVAVGWEAAHGPTRGQQIARLEEENQALKAALSRFGGP